MAALIRWNPEHQRWFLHLQNAEGVWRVVASWTIKDKDKATSNGWIHDSILCEIAHLQQMGYEIKVEI